MSNTIGDTAGVIWNYLDKNGPSSVNKVTTETGINRNDVQRAIGWLCKEDKLSIEMIGRAETLSLK
ncbi:MAG: winged helix-turn-helix domain-containing protein [Methylobacter sp.]|uniref:winged helix-turn-helix domain-containing protein n=1 Tax=Methylobacter sp. TaxID=2051955 RepID=UPI0027243D2A|nr:winged helix-turn-helix domain-containing protein [Methylobacter sp.]MDO9268416.1 winged helix-turn-helix domain-containing protein [Methylobacter sp.]MDP1663695.1 winged helix-turn-helix domain-containing protein [Methylobacter sp.]MDP1970497.1 winged helix-turn-helix domain-containing protein [Methylobacter sp.]